MRNRVLTTIKTNTMSSVEIKGDATLCFDESRVEFQGVIHTSDAAQYAIRGTKEEAKTKRKSRQEQSKCESDASQCGCAKAASKNCVTYDISIVDCEAGDEYALSKVHGCGSENMSLSCDKMNFNATQTFIGQKAVLETQRLYGNMLEGRRGTVCQGPIEILAPQTPPTNRPWVL